MSLLQVKFIEVITVSYSAPFCCNVTRNSQFHHVQSQNRSDSKSPSLARCMFTCSV